MPLLKGQPYEVIKALPAGLRPEEEVFVIKATQEVVRSYDEYLKKSSQYTSTVWSCKYTKKSGLSYEEAQTEEAKAKEALAKFPKDLEEQVCRAVHHSTRRLEDLVAAIYDTFRPPKGERTAGGDASQQPQSSEQAASPLGAKENKPQQGGAAAAPACSLPAAAGAAKRKVPKAPVTKPQVRAYIVEYASQQGPENATKLAWVICPELTQRFGLAATLPEALSEELAASVKAPKKRPPEASAAGGEGIKKAKKSAAEAGSKAAKPDSVATAGAVETDESAPTLLPVKAKSLEEVEAQYAPGTVKHAVVATLKAAAPAGLNVGGVMEKAKDLGVREFEPKHKIQIAQILSGDPNFVRLDKGVYSLHALHPHLLNLTRPAVPRKRSHTGESAGGEGSAEAGKAAKLPSASSEADLPGSSAAAKAAPAVAAAEGGATRAERVLKQAKASLSRHRSALQKAAAAVDEAKRQFAAARKQYKSPSKERRTSDVFIPPELLEQFELPEEERGFKGDHDDRKGMLEHRQKLQARARALDKARRVFLEAEHAKRDAELKESMKGLKEVEGALRKAEAGLAAARRGVEGAEKAVAAAEKGVQAEMERGERSEQLSEKEKAKAAEREERERRRAEVVAAKRYPIDDQELLQDLKRAAAAGEAPVAVAEPTWLEPEDASRLAACLYVSDLFNQFGRTLGVKGLSLADFQAALVAATGGRPRDDQGQGQGPAALHSVYQRTLAFLLDDLRGQGAASAAEKRWASLLGESTWPEVLRRFVLTRAGAEEPFNRPDERTSLAASMLAFDGADALTQDQHLALLRFLADEVLDSERMRSALQKREEDALDAVRDIKGDMAEERRRLRELAEAEKEGRRQKREEEKRRLEEDQAAAGAAAEGSTAAAAGAAKKAVAADDSAAGGDTEPSFELPPELAEYSGDPNDKKALLVWRQAQQAERRRLEKAKARWLGDHLRAQRLEEARLKEAQAAEKAKQREREEAERALEEAEEALEAQLEKNSVRRVPLGSDRHHRRYWWGLGADRGVLYVEDAAGRWGSFSSADQLAALYESLDRRGVRELALAQALERKWDSITGPMLRAAARAAAADKAQEKERERERAAPLRASGRATKQAEFFNPCQGQPRPTSAASGRDSAHTRAAPSPLEALFGPSELAAVEALADAVLSLQKEAAGAGVVAPSGFGSWKAWGAAAAAAKKAEIPPDEHGAVTLVTAAGIRRVLQAKLMQAEEALFAAAEEPEEDDESSSDEGRASGEAEGGGAGSSGGEEGGDGGGLPRPESMLVLEAVDEEFSPTKLSRDVRLLWRTAKERTLWLADLRQSATAARLAYAAALLAQQAAPLLRSLRRIAHGATPAPAKRKTSATAATPKEKDERRATRARQQAVPVEVRQAMDRDARAAERAALH